MSIHDLLMIFFGGDIFWTILLLVFLTDIKKIDITIENLLIFVAIYLWPIALLTALAYGVVKSIRKYTLVKFKIE